MSDNNVTIFKDTWTKEGVDVNIFTVLSAIKGGKWATKITHLQSLPKEQYKEEKKSLPAVTFSGTFSCRRADGLLVYSNFVVVDIDNLEASVLTDLRVNLLTDKYVLSYFASPSGNGLKVLVQVDNAPEHHHLAAMQLENYFSDQYNIKVDASGKDVCRLCYVSSDPDLHLKQNEVFAVNTTPAPVKPVKHYTVPFDPNKGPATEDPDYIYDVCKKWVDAKFIFAMGSRNIYIHAMASALNRCGVSRGDAISLLENNLPPIENTQWHQSVKSAYINQASDHASVIVYDVDKKEDQKNSPAFVPSTVPEIHFCNIVLGMRQCNMPYNVIRKLMRLSYPVIYSAELLLAAEDMYQKQALQEVSAMAGSLESFSEEIMAAFVNTKNVLTYNSAIDECLGGLINGNLYGLVGCEKTFKSILAMHMVIENAKRGVESIYFNMEMSTAQFFALAALMITGIDIVAEQKFGTMSQVIFMDAMDKVHAALNNKVIIMGQIGIRDHEIAGLVNKRRATGGDPKLIIIDGLSHLHQPTKDEISSAIENSKLMKQLAKDINLPIVALMHTTNACEKHMRSPIDYVRSGIKIRANLDAYISNSLIIDQEKSTIEKDAVDIIYRKRMLWVRCFDARNSGNMVDKVFKMDDNLAFVDTKEDPKNYEFHVKSKR